tara:strand:- start:3494 stop:4243 length:750 start_codon:yes stop_codon:yes gene_type:complete
MKQVILAAGYATRLHPLTQNTPKPLLHVGNRPIIEHVIGSTSAIGTIDRTYIVTNNKFSGHFKHWLTEYQQDHPNFYGKVVNDGTTSNENRLGAIGDLHLVLTQEDITDDILVVAGDNLFTGDLSKFGECCREHQEPILGVFDVRSPYEAKKYGVVAIDDSGQVTSFEEKPSEPKSTLIGIALYYYPKEILSEISRYLAEGNNPDQPGRFVQWLYPQQPVYTSNIPEKWLDIGSKETLEAANTLFISQK